MPLFPLLTLAIGAPMVLVAAYILLDARFTATGGKLLIGPSVSRHELADSDLTPDGLPWGWMAHQIAETKDDL